MHVPDRRPEKQEELYSSPVFLMVVTLCSFTNFIVHCDVSPDTMKM